MATEANPIYAKIGEVTEAIFDSYWLRLEKDKSIDEYDSWSDYADNTYEISVVFRDRLKESNFVLDRLVFDFGKKVLVIAEVGVYSALRQKDEEVKQFFSRQKSENEKIKGSLEKLSAEYEERKGEGLLEDPNYKLLMARKKEFTEALGDEYKGIKEEMVGHALRVVMSSLSHYIEMLQKCETPLEEAFLAGIFAWTELWYPEKFVCQHHEGEHSLDFALFQKDEEGNISGKIDIEIDEHTHDEKTLKQATEDTQRDSELEGQGWKVLRFHRQEIEEDLRGCIESLRKQE